MRRDGARGRGRARPRRSARAAADDAIARAGLQYVGDWRTGRLDAEGFRRLSLALAIAGDPDLVVLDDPWVLSDTLREIARGARARRRRAGGRRRAPPASRRPSAGASPWPTGRRGEGARRPDRARDAAPVAAHLDPDRRGRAGLAAGPGGRTAVAATHQDLAREDSLRRGAATLLLLGGLALAIALGSAALNHDAENGHFGFLVGSGRVAPGPGGRRRRRPPGRRSSRSSRAWAVVLQAGSVVLRLGFDGPLAVHTLAVAVGLVLAMIACAAASSVVGPAAAGLFGGGVYVLAQAAVNLKAAADQGLIGTADTGRQPPLLHRPAHGDLADDRRPPAARRGRRRRAARRDQPEHGLRPRRRAGTPWSGRSPGACCWRCSAPPACAAARSTSRTGSPWSG